MGRLGRSVPESPRLEAAMSLWCCRHATERPSFKLVLFRGTRAAICGRYEGTNPKEFFKFSRRAVITEKRLAAGSHNWIQSARQIFWVTFADGPRRYSCFLPLAAAQKGDATTLMNKWIIISYLRAMQSNASLSHPPWSSRAETMVEKQVSRFPWTKAVERTGGTFGLFGWRNGGLRLK